MDLTSRKAVLSRKNVLIQEQAWPMSSGHSQGGEGGILHLILQSAIPESKGVGVEC